MRFSDFQRLGIGCHGLVFAKEEIYNQWFGNLHDSKMYS